MAWMAFGVLCVPGTCGCGAICPLLGLIVFLLCGNRPSQKFTSNSFRYFGDGYFVCCEWLVL